MIIECKDRDIYLYILELVDYKFYVGQSIDPDKRIKAHFKGKGSAWTKKFQPICLVKKWNTQLKDWKQAEILENKNTLSLMHQYGWINVRGGFWSNTSERETFKGLKHHERYIRELGFNLPFN
jgi:predicted GIY-YIG superfamily endonuclease